MGVIWNPASTSGAPPWIANQARMNGSDRKTTLWSRLSTTSTASALQNRLTQIPWCRTVCQKPRCQRVTCFQ